MTTQRYSVTQQSIDTLFGWIHSGEIAIPEIQRPFVWDAVKVRDLLDSLSKGFPVGYLIAWRNPNVKLKDGSLSSGKKILIDGQQRVTALMASLLGREVFTKDYRKVPIRIAFHPIEHRFEVTNPAIQKDAAWIPDISAVFSAGASLLTMVQDYCAKNSATTQEQVLQSILELQAIKSNQVGLIELSHELDIETVTEIFIRVNSAAVPLSQADFAMSKIAVNETYGGNTLRKAIDYFCHLSVAPDVYETVKNDKTFASSPYLAQMSWLRKENDDLYDPAYTDMLRVAFTSEFRRGRLEELVALLSGRNFETKQYEEAIVEDSFRRLGEGIERFISETNFKRFVMIIRSAGFVDASMIGSQNALNFAYILYLSLRTLNLPPGDIEKAVRRWFVFSIIKGRYSGSPESTIDYDIKQVHGQGIEKYWESLQQGELSDAFWDSLLPQELDTSSGASPFFRIYEAAQVKMNDMGFLSKDISVKDLIEYKSDVHHVFPKDYLKKNGLARGQYNQIANYVVAQSEINIQIGNKEPKVYFGQLQEQCAGGKVRYGNIRDSGDLKKNFEMNCIPAGVEEMTVAEYPEFLAERRALMSKKIKRYFALL